MNQFFKKNLKEVDAILLSSWGNITYLSGYSGFSQTERECFLLITSSKQYLITDGRYSEAVKEQTKNLPAGRQVFEIIDSGAARFIAKDHSNFLKDLRITSLGIEEYDLTVSEYLKLKKSLKLKAVDLRNLRIVKQKQEIENIKKACEIGDLAFIYIVKQLKVDISERELADKLETFINSKNADFSFKPIVAFGKNSSIPHHVSGKTKLRKNQIVLLDFGVKVNNYCSDMSRTFFFGIAPNEFKKMHKAVLSAQTKAIEYINSQLLDVKGQLLSRAIDGIARDYLRKHGFPTIPHSLGHGIGIEVHEPPHLSPHSKDKIEKGMVFSIEPGIYIPGYGGVRIEDLVLITSNGVELISRANREIIEV